LLSNDDVIKGGVETEKCDQLLLDVRFEPDAGKYTLLLCTCMARPHWRPIKSKSTKSLAHIRCDVIKRVACMKPNRKLTNKRTLNKSVAIAKKADRILHATYGIATEPKHRLITQ